MTEEAKAEDAVVIPEVVDGDYDLQVRAVPPAITANVDKVRDYVDAQLAVYRDTRIDPSDARQVKQARKDMAYLNKLKARVADARKQVKRVAEQPIRDFEAQVKPIEATIEEVRGEIKAQVDAADEAFREHRREWLSGQYAELAGAVSQLIPADVLVTGEMLRRSTLDEKALDDLMESAKDAYRSYKRLEGMELSHKAEAVRTFCETASLDQALQTEESLNEQDRKREAFEKRRQAVRKAAEPEEPVSRWHLELDFEGTRDKAREVGASLKALGLAGKIRKVG